MEEVKKLRKAQKKYESLLSGSAAKKVIGAAGTLAGVALTGGLAFAFAPVIAPVIATAIFGESLAGLSGAALTSASLALLGGGSLAVGGLGMAGGTMVVAGGGALLGLAGGAGVSAASMSLLSNDSFVLEECCKLLTYSRVVLIDKYNDPYSVADIQYSVEDRILALKKDLDAFEEAKRDDKEVKGQIRICQRSLKYLEKANVELTQMIEEERLAGIGTAYKGFNPRFYMHERDRIAFRALKSVPGFAPVMKFFKSQWDEELNHIRNMADNVLISDKQLSRYYEMLPPICEKLGIEIPELYLEYDPFANAYTAGDTKPYIVITSGLLETVPDELIPTVLAHECGHIACHHNLYSMMGMLLFDKAFEGIWRLPIAHEISELLSVSLEWAWFAWMRASELSADRAAVLCDGSADKTIELCMRFAGFDKDIQDEASVEAFMSQAEGYEEMLNTSLKRKAMSFYLFNRRDHPMNAVRALECKRWADSEQFKALIDAGAK